jgi:hypothetical protein
MEYERLRIWALNATVYLLAVFAPVIVTDPVTPPMPLFWVFVGIGFTVITYNGLRAWGQGNRRPMIHHTLIPLGLFGLSLLLYWTGAWRHILLGLRGMHG